MKSRVGLLEGLGDGHRLAYVGRIVRTALAEGHEVVLVMSREARVQASREWITHIGETGRTLRVLLHTAARRFDPVLLGRALKESDLLCIPDGDRWVPVLLLHRLRHLGGRVVPVRLLIMRPYPPPGGGSARVNYFLKLLMIRALQIPGFATRVGVLQASGGRVPPAWTNSVVVHDPPLSTRLLPESETAKASAGLAGAVVTSILGVVGPRKNPRLVLDALVLLARRDPAQNWVLYLPGEVQDEVRLALEQDRDGVQVVIGGHHLDGAAYSAAFAASDVIAVVHDNEGSSGVLTEAAAYGRKAVAGGVQTVRAQGAALGAVVPRDGSAESLADAILEAHHGHGMTVPSVSSGTRFENFFLDD